MLIDVPVLIAFDVNEGMSFDYRKLDRAVSRLTLTLRFDTDDPDKPIRYTGHYPPRDNDESQWSTDTDGVIAGLMPYGCEKKLIERARRNPADYCADPAEGDTLQEQVDEQRRQDGQFGAGA